MPSLFKYDILNQINTQINYFLIQTPMDWQDLKTENQDYSLKQNTKNRFAAYIRNLRQQHNIQQLALVLDLPCLRILSNLFAQAELIACGIQFIERLELKRKSLPLVHALYFMQPKLDQINALISDYPDERPTIGKYEPKYKRLHLLFPYKVDKSILGLISEQRKVMKYLVPHSIKEFFSTVLFTDSNVFTLNVDSYLKVAYSAIDSDREKILRKKICARFSEIFCSIGPFYQVDIYYRLSPSNLAGKIANGIADSITEITGMMLKNGSKAVDKSAKSIQLIVIDRAADPITPFLHDFYYESMIADVVKIPLFKKLQPVQSTQHSEKPKTNKSVKSKQKSQKQTNPINVTQIELVPKNKGETETIIEKQLPKTEMPKCITDIHDSVFDKYRYRHFAEILENLPEDIRKLKSQVENVKLEEAGLIDIKRAKKYELHQKLVRECNRLFNELDLENIAELEQSLATGVDSNGAETSSIKLLQKVKELCKNEIPSGFKLRLALLACCAVSLSETDYKSLVACFDESENLTFRNLLWLGVQLKATIKRSTKNIGGHIRKNAVVKMQQTQMNLDRYSSTVENILPLILEAWDKQITSLDQKVFGKCIVNENEKHTFRKVQETKKPRKLVNIPGESKPKIKVLIFFVGGVTYSEIRAIRGISKKFENYDIIVGSDCQVTGDQYCECIREMQEPLEK